MLRSVLERRSEVQDNPSTPLRGGAVGFPRIRLVDRHSKLNQVPIYTLSSNNGLGGGATSLGNNLGSSRPGNGLSTFDNRRYFSVADRFIPQRRHRNIDAVHYNLTKNQGPQMRKDLDVFDQIKHLDETWRKTIMKNAVAKANLMPGLNDRRIYNFADRENRRPISDFTHHRNWFDFPMRTKARKKPLISHCKFTIKVRPSTSLWPMTGSIAWGARNFIAVIVDKPIGSSILLFNAAINSNLSTISQPVHTLAEIIYQITVIQWNHAGDKIAAITDNAELRVYTMDKLSWMRKCTCSEDLDETACQVAVVAWTHSDNEILICCWKDRLSSYTSSGDLTRTVFPHLGSRDTINSIGFSLNDRHLAITACHSFFVYTWPGFVPLLEVGHRPGTERLMTIAWHPWDPNVICIGSSPDTNSLSLWDIQRHEILGWRKTVPGFIVDELTWNKLSGELVVRFDHTGGNQEERSIVAVLSNLDRIVDVVYNGHQCYDLVWSPDSTQLAVGRGGVVKIWNFFGSETQKWHATAENDEKVKKKFDLKRRKDIFTDHTRHLEHYNIR